ncbi:M57 family metalloprotease [Myxococcus fulvus]
MTHELGHTLGFRHSDSLDVNTSGCGFSSPPVLHLPGRHRQSPGRAGATSIYTPSATGFRVYVTFPGITASQANTWGWHLNWSAVDPFARSYPFLLAEPLGDRLL